MNRRLLILALGVTTSAVAAGVAVAMLQSAPKTAIAPAPQPTTTMTPEPIAAAPTPDPTPVSVSPTPSPTAPPEIVAKPPAEPTRTVTSCRLTMVRVDDPEPPLNVRSSPTTAAQNVVGQVQNGTYLSVTQEQDGWLQITDPVAGWVAKSRTQSSCNEKIERVSFGAGNTSAEISDRFIGTGFHQYQLNAAAGQTITLSRQSGPLPVVLKPNGQMLAEIPDDRDRWSGALPGSGDYVLQLDSNYKGYAYSFVVEIK